MDSKENKNQSYFRQAFARNLGLLSESQQEVIRNKTVGIAGLGGVGGSYALGLARAGVGKLIISDLDHFEVVNMNRQAGAMTSTIGVSKVDAIVRMLKDINPYIQIETYSDGINPKNVMSFVQKADVVIDAIDFYCIETHRLLHSACREQGKIALFSAPIGCSATLQIFKPTGMSFEEYFDFKNCGDYLEKFTAFAVGCAPKPTHWSYMHLSGEALAAGTPPSLVSAVNLCAGFIINSVLMILTGAEDELRYAPHFVQCDARKFKLVKGSLPFGNRGLIQRIKRWALALRFASWREQINLAGEKKGNPAFTDPNLEQKAA